MRISRILIFLSFDFTGKIRFEILRYTALAEDYESNLFSVAKKSKLLSLQTVKRLAGIVGSGSQFLFGSLTEHWLFDNSFQSGDSQDLKYPYVSSNCT